MANNNSYILDELIDLFIKYRVVNNDLPSGDYFHELHNFFSDLPYEVYYDDDDDLHIDGSAVDDDVPVKNAEIREFLQDFLLDNLVINIIDEMVRVPWKYDLVEQINNVLDQYNSRFEVEGPNDESEFDVIVR